MTSFIQMAYYSHNVRLHKSQDNEKSCTFFKLLFTECGSVQEHIPPSCPAVNSLESKFLEVSSDVMERTKRAVLAGKVPGGGGALLVFGIFFFRCEHTPKWRLSLIQINQKHRIAVIEISSVCTIHKHIKPKRTASARKEDPAFSYTRLHTSTLLCAQHWEEHTTP